MCAVLLPIIIVVTLSAVPAGFTHHGKGIRYELLQTFNQLYFSALRPDIRALLTVLCQPVVSVFKPGKFSVVLRMVSECTATQVAGVVSIRCGLCSTGRPVRRPLPSRAIKDFAYIVIFLSRQTTRSSSRPGTGQRGQGVNGGSVKIWTGVWVKQAGCCYSTVVVTQWNTDVKKQSVGEWIHRCRQTTTHTFGLPDIGAPVVLDSRPQPKLRSPVQ